MENRRQQDRAQKAQRIKIFYPGKKIVSLDSLMAPRGSSSTWTDQCRQEIDPGTQVSLKKITAILLLSVHCFNMAGYQLFFNHLIKRTDQKMSTRIDKNNYQKDDLVELKIALNLPYYSDWKDYERFDGEIELNHVVHRYVMRKITNDTLFLLCLPDYDKTKLADAKTNYIGYVNENAKHSTENSAGKAIAKKAIFPDECQLLVVNTGNNYISYNSALQYHLFKKTFFLNHILAVPGKPPQS